MYIMYMYMYKNNKAFHKDTSLNNTVATTPALEGEGS